MQNNQLAMGENMLRRKTYFMYTILWFMKTMNIFLRQKFPDIQYLAVALKDVAELAIQLIPKPYNNQL